MKLVCEYCNKEFESPRPRKTCSKECQYRQSHKTTKIYDLSPKHCIICGKEFKPSGDKVNTCSTKCGYLYRTKSRLQSRIVLTCPICGDEYYSPPHRGKKTCNNIECAKLLREQTWQTKYGVSNPSKNKSVKLKQKNTNLSRYGKYRSDDAIQKSKNTCLVKYGTPTPLQCKKIKDKAKQTCLDKYNRVNGAQKDIPEEVLELFSSKESLEEAYNHFDVSAVTLAKKYGVSQSFVLMKLHSFNIPVFYKDSNPDKTSYEAQLEDFIKSLGIEVCRKVRSILPSKKELDLFLPEKMIGIEFNGLFWHSEQLQKSNNIPKEYHLNKTLEMESLGFQLIHIYEDDWIYKKDIVKHRLKSLLNKSDKIWARKCYVREIALEEKSIFNSKYHLQGDCVSSINLGLFFDGSLIATMTFGKLRKVLNQTHELGTYELLRFCSSGTVVGGASKLFSYFIKTFKPEKVFSYADRHWTSSIKSNLYTKLGFRKISDGYINYWYIVNGKRVHRFNYRKSELVRKLKRFNPKFSEYQNMLDNGYDRIWGCGSLKYEWVNNK